MLPLTQRGLASSIPRETCRNRLGHGSDSSANCADVVDRDRPLECELNRRGQLCLRPPPQAATVDALERSFLRERPVYPFAGRSPCLRACAVLGGCNLCGSGRGRAVQAPSRLGCCPVTKKGRVSPTLSPAPGSPGRKALVTVPCETRTATNSRVVTVARRATQRQRLSPRPSGQRCPSPSLSRALTAGTDPLGRDGALSVAYILVCASVMRLWRGSGSDLDQKWRTR